MCDSTCPPGTDGLGQREDGGSQGVPSGAAALLSSEVLLSASRAAPNLTFTCVPCAGIICCGGGGTAQAAALSDRGAGQEGHRVRDAGQLHVADCEEVPPAPDASGKGFVCASVMYSTVTVHDGPLQ